MHVGTKCLGLMSYSSLNHIGAWCYISLTSRHNYMQQESYYCNYCTWYLHLVKLRKSWIVFPEFGGGEGTEILAWFCQIEILSFFWSQSIHCKFNDVHCTIINLCKIRTTMTATTPQMAYRRPNVFSRAIISDGFLPVCSFRNSKFQFLKQHSISDNRVVRHCVVFPHIQQTVTCQLDA